MNRCDAMQAFARVVTTRSFTKAADTLPVNKTSLTQLIQLLGARTGKALPYAMQRGAERMDVQGRHVFWFDDGNAYLAAALAGLGIAWLPDHMARLHLARGALLPLFDDSQLELTPLYLAYPPNRHVSAKLRAFIDWVVALMAQHAPVVSLR
ncbi:LysR family transcriptional regulator [Pseudorhodoferax sp. Leaf267]|uniref:LysR family transcriptional regulator n=1 Tax=Pseudorhodoferax sp. Leaf267 TaxID=1736316 RepID=UPI0009EA2B63|nr:LysR family transcriptional regulator [Pseudorhodoferax sp. Leaf267]